MQVVDVESGQQSAFDYLFTNQNHDGGWNYKLQGQSFTEPTAMTVLALLSPVGAGAPDNKVNTARVQAVKTGLDWLRTSWHDDGGWGVFHEDPFSNWNTYVGAWVFTVLLKTPLLAGRFAQPGDDQKLQKTRDFILNSMRERPVSTDDYALIKRLFSIDSNFLGFSWGAGEAGWVIPTSLALIALTAYDPAKMVNDPVIQNGKDYLYDRSCPDGGWNVGNPYMFDKKLPATADATSYALLAWQATNTAADFNRTDVTNAAVTTLMTFHENSKSDLTLALSTWALRFWKDDLELYTPLLRGVTDQQTKQVYTEGQNKLGGWNDSPFTTAVAALALSQTPYYFKPA